MNNTIDNAINEELKLDESDDESIMINLRNLLKIEIVC